MIGESACACGDPHSSTNEHNPPERELLCWWPFARVRIPLTAADKPRLMKMEGGGYKRNIWRTKTYKTSESGEGVPRDKVTLLWTHVDNALNGICEMINDTAAQQMNEHTMKIVVVAKHTHTKRSHSHALVQGWTMLRQYSTHHDCDGGGWERQIITIRRWPSLLGCAQLMVNI